MKSIYVLNKYGVSFTIIKKIFLLDILYIDLEFFGYSVLKDKGIIGRQSDLVMSAYYKSINDNAENSIIELQLYGLTRNYTNMLVERNITFEDIIQLTKEEFCNKYNVTRKMYIEVCEAYNNFAENNYNIPLKLEYSKYLLEIVKKIATLKMVDLAEVKESALKTSYPINYFNKDIDILTAQGLIEIKDNKITCKLSNIIDEINNMDTKKKDILLKRWNGCTLQEIANDHGLTRERIRQIIAGTYAKLPPVNEDKYKNIYEKYDLSEEQFISVFAEPKSTYYYLFDRYTKGKIEFTELEKDSDMDEEMLKRIRLFNNEICFHGVYMNADRTDVTKYFMKYRIEGETTISELCRRVNSFISEDLSNYNIETYKSDHNLEAILSRKNWCVFGRNKKVRYYEMDLLSEKDMSQLNDLLNVEYGLYSSLYFYENNRELMEALDIRNEQELHNILKNLITKANVIYLRMPNILIGYRDKEEFFLDKFAELCPISQAEFLSIMRLKYGHREDSLLSYLTLEFNEYLKGNQITSKPMDLRFEQMKIDF